MPLYCRHIEWDEAESSDGAAAVVNWAQFRQEGQIRDKPMSYDHGHFHDGARIAFLVGTPKEFEIGFIYGVRKSHGDESMALALVPMGVYEVQEDHPGEGSPKAGGGYVVTVDLTATPCVISFGEDREGKGGQFRRKPHTSAYLVHVAVAPVQLGGGP